MKLLNNKKKLSKKRNEAISLRRRTLDRVAPVGVLELLLGFIPDIRRKRINRAIDALETSGFIKETKPLHQPEARIEDVQRVCNLIVQHADQCKLPDNLLDREKEAKNNSNQAILTLEAAQTAQHDHDECWKKISIIVNRINLDTRCHNFTPTSPEGLRTKYAGCPDDLIDNADDWIRRRLFFVALRYWESRWLDTVQTMTVESKPSQKENDVKGRYLRYAMLTPCFVATCYQANIFDYFDDGRNTPGKTPKAKARPLCGFFDLLIVDEAGQVNPEIGGPCFFLGKRAVVIGDTKQIAPIVSLNKHVDAGNLHKHDLWEQKQELDQKGFLATSGTVMHLAQGATRFSLQNDATPGMFLSEHRRCFNEIISYCNSIYQGRLEPKRGNAPESWLPPVAYAHIRGVSEKISGSWRNNGEAHAIADWLARNREKLEDKYKTEIGNIVAIVTPFAQQATAIRIALEKQKIPTGSKKANSVTVGSVHSLQGAERRVILFSSVYVSNVSQRYFFDRDETMLNVAVSRAQDHFIVFGDMNIFDPKAPSPSGQLARHLFESETNEITDVISAQGILAVAKTHEVQHLNTLDQHRSILVKAINQAQNRLLIVSPFLSNYALQADNLPDLLRLAMQRNVDVRIVTCADNLAGSNRYTEKSAKLGLSLLLEAGIPTYCLNRIHNKTLAVDDILLIEGSFNWFSASRDPNRSNIERSLTYSGPNVKRFIEGAWQETSPNKDAVSDGSNNEPKGTPPKAAEVS